MALSCEGWSRSDEIPQAFHVGARTPERKRSEQGGEEKGEREIEEEQEERRREDRERKAEGWPEGRGRPEEGKCASSFAVNA
ncbi:hypothetical protein ACLOJK_026785 [Asimina triloba]